MSDPFPPSPHDPEPEYLGPAAPGDGRPASSRRWGPLAAGAAGVVLAAGVGSWGVAQLMAGGESPASAVPSIAVAYVSVDLDPSATQKIEALRMLKKFPAIAAELDLGIRDDLRHWVFERIQGEGMCPDVDYGRDVEPWLGDRVAVAAVPDDDAPLAPLLVVQVSDRDAASRGVVALRGCAEGDPGGNRPAGVAFVGDYMLVSEEQDDADAMAKAAEAATLEDDEAFATWMARIGEPGVVTAYASADAPRLIVETGIAQGKERMSTTPDGRDSFDATGNMSEEMLGMYGDASRSLWKDFGGMAGVLRFSDGSMEAEVAAEGLPAGMASTDARTGPALGDLPETTAAALTVSLPDGWLQGYLDTIGGMLGSGESLDEFWGGIESDTGLRLPEDIEALLGDGVSLSVDASADLQGLTIFSALPELPVALRISGDPKEITRVLDILKAQLGSDGEKLVVGTGNGLVVVGLQQDYVDSLLGAGTLGDLDAFTSVVPEADRASGALFVNFDAGEGWLDSLADGDAEAAANLAPLDALGISAWSESGVQHGLFRLTTD